MQKGFGLMGRVMKVLVVFAISLALVGTNPKVPDYASWLHSEALQHSGGGILNTLSVDLFASQGEIESHTTVKNFLVFSLFHTTMDNNDISVLGVANQFIALPSNAP